MTSNNHFRIMDLPGELRNRIYEAALVKARPVRLESKDRWSITGVRQTKKFITKWKIPALLHANRQLRAETMGIYLALNTFDIGSSWWLDGVTCDELAQCVLERLVPTLQILEPGHRLLVSRIRICGIKPYEASEARKEAKEVQIALYEVHVGISKGVIAVAAWATEGGAIMSVTEDTEVAE